MVISRLSNFVVIASVLGSTLFADDVIYRYNDIHTKIPKKGVVSIGAGYQILNDTVDILDIKGSEFGDSKQFDSIGDLDGYEFFVHYSITDDLMIYYKNGKTNIEYGSKEMSNMSNDIYARYHILDKLSFDFGYVQNRLDDFYVKDIDSMNTLGKRYFGEDNFALKQNNGQTILYHKDEYSILQYEPWIGFDDTKDDSIYIRAISDILFDELVLDYYASFKYTKIQNHTVANKELISIDPSIKKDLGRDEMMFSVGLSSLYKYKRAFLELGYKFDIFDRDENLDYINNNHTVDLTVGYSMSKSLSIFISGKAMSNQLNGQIPYLYNEYTQTTYDHKYGYVTTGLQYNF